ncbi:hypothetical protein [Methylobacterium sp. WL9]|uniref:hypothetical protein n=1 Tax=Methylobacterium sp. WL9 TaxID=2603898 RepID=UPI0011CCDA66|nr:hypothetical protein [Methylobacterium sp. WL9]TXN24469.1 hypothetical protein FV217_03090 [Methylobacterium sp. WL9]
MSEQQHERPSPETGGASHVRSGQDSGIPSPPDGGVPSQFRDALKGGPDGEARESIERATSVVGDDEGDAS